MITLYHNLTREPVELQRLMRDELLVRRYKMPEKVGSLYTPAADNKTEGFAYDRTQTLWEVLLSNPEAEESLGMHIPVGCIVQTQRRFPQDTGLEDADGERCMLLSVEACGVKGIITYNEEDS